MKRLLLALAATMALVPEAPAQNAITQEGSVIQNSPMMFRGNNRARQGAGVGGAPTGQIVNTGDAVVGGRCDYSAPNDASGGYYSLCIDAATGKIKFGGTKSPQIPLIFEINGSTYGFPGPGNGNVVGPDPSTMNEITSWNSTTGTALRQGAASITQDMGSAISADGSPITARNTTAFTAAQILDAAFILPPGSGSQNYDAMRGMAFAPVNTTINLVNGVSAYVVSDAASTGVGGFPAVVGLFSAGVARGTNAKVWGINTLLSDTFTGAVSAGTGKSLNNEFDFNVSSPNTTVIGLSLAGGSKAQPAAAVGVALQPLDLGQGSPAGSIARWSSFLLSVAGSTNVFAGIGAKQAVGSSIQSQDIVFAFKDAAGADANIVMTGSEAGGLSLYTTNNLGRALRLMGGAGRLAMEDGSGIAINERIVMQGLGSNFGVGADVNYVTQTYGNAASSTAILGSSISMLSLPGSAGAGGLTVCVDTSGVLYKKASCP